MTDVCTCGQVSIRDGRIHGLSEADVTHCFDGSSCYPTTPLSVRIQVAIEKEAKIWGADKFYKPSPGQIWSHVAHRITQVVMRVLEDEGVW